MRTSLDELVHDLFASTVFDSHPLGMPILGTVDTYSSLSPDSSF